MLLLIIIISVVTSDAVINITGDVVVNITGDAIVNVVNITGDAGVVMIYKDQVGIHRSIQDQPALNLSNWLSI